MEARQPLEQGLVGARFDKYEILEEVGFGGMSVVYRAHDGVLDREVAVKLLHPHLARRDESRRRFEREARAVAKLRHPNIVEIYDFSGEDSPHSYIVTEFIRGPTLREFVDAHGVRFPELGAMIATPIAEALVHAHEHGVLHRDIKPENVMIRPDGVVKLMDFGIAQLRDAQKMTETGSLLGSPAHMAPEVVSGEEPDARSDIFSLGTVLYFLATGELPFGGRNAAVILRTIVEGRYVDPEMQSPRVGAQLGGVIRKCLAGQPDERFQTAKEVVAALRAVTEEVGLTDGVTEVRRYFADPGAYEVDFREEVLTTLERRGRQLLEEREVARAVDCFNRVLAIDDGHEGVRRLLTRLDRRRRMAGYGLAVSSLLAVMAIVLLATGVFSGPARPDREQAERARDGAVIDGGNRAAVVALEAQRHVELRVAVTVARARDRTEQAVDVSRRDARVRADTLARASAETAHSAARNQAEARRAERERARRVDGPVEAPEVATPEGSGVGSLEVATSAAPVLELTPVRLRPYPLIVSLTIDGELAGDFGDFTGGIIHLTPGEHRIRYGHPAVHADTQIIHVPRPGELPPDATAYPAQPFRLDWQDATLLVESDVDVLVLIDGEPAGAGGEPITVSLNDTQESQIRGRASVDVTVIPNDGGVPRTFPDEEFLPNQRRTLAVRFGE